LYLELRQAFDLFDTDNSGGISVPELKQALAALGVTITDQEARQMFSAIDVDSKDF
jgi:Ca2+-binding EF-hand superfamily protein